MRTVFNCPLSQCLLRFCSFSTAEYCYKFFMFSLALHYHVFVWPFLPATDDSSSAIDSSPVFPTYIYCLNCFLFIWSSTVFKLFDLYPSSAVYFPVYLLMHMLIWIQSLFRNLMAILWLFLPITREPSRIYNDCWYFHCNNSIYFASSKRLYLARLPSLICHSIFPFSSTPLIL